MSYGRNFRGEARSGICSVSTKCIVDPVNPGLCTHHQPWRLFEIAQNLDATLYKHVRRYILPVLSLPTVQNSTQKAAVFIILKINDMSVYTAVGLQTVVRNSSASILVFFNVKCRAETQITSPKWSDIESAQSDVRFLCNRCCRVSCWCRGQNLVKQKGER